MSGKSKWDYLKAIYFRYRKASKALRSRILDEFCQVWRYNRKYAVRLLNGPAPQKPNTPFQGPSSDLWNQSDRALTMIWQAAGYPCSARLKALLPLWLPWAVKRLTLSAIGIDAQELKRQSLLDVFHRTEDADLTFTHDCSGFHPGGVDVGDIEGVKKISRSRVAGVRDQIDLGKARHLNIPGVGFDGDVMLEQGGGFGASVEAVFESTLFGLQASVDGRPYKKDDNTHIEQKNWTHVRKISAMNAMISSRPLKP